MAGIAALGTLKNRAYTFLVFFLPVVIGIGIASFNGWHTMRQQEENLRLSSEAQGRDLGFQQSANELSNQMLGIHDSLLAVLREAKAGKLDEGMAYQAHTQIVDNLSAMAGALDTLIKTNPYTEINPILLEAKSDLQAYWQYAVSATDIVAIDPSQARFHIDEATTRYIHFAEHVLDINTSLARIHKERIDSGSRRIAEATGELEERTLANSLIIIVLWGLIVLIASRQLARITSALQRLDRQERLDGRQLAALKQIQNFLLRDLAQATLSFDAAQQDRDSALTRLHSEQQQLMSLFNSMPDMVWFKDALGRYIRCNPRFSEFAGIPEATLHGKTDHDLFPKAEADHYAARDQLAGQSDTQILEQEWRSFPDGHRALIEVIKVAVRHPDGSLAGVLGVGRDITAQYLAHQETQQSQQVLKRTQDVARIGSWIYDYRLNMLVGAEESYRLLGIPLGATFTPRQFLPFIHPDDRQRVIEAWRAAQHDGLFQIEHRLLLGGLTLWVSQRAEMERDTSGNLLRAVGMVQDITERKQAESELDGYRNHLEELIEARTRELAEARDAAQAASRSKSAFLANMSHEIRTPMNAIIGLTHILRRTSAQPHQVQQLDKITGAANHLLGIINDILDFSKIEAGKMHLDNSNFEIDRIIDNVCNLITEKVQNKGLELVADIATLPALMHGDGMRIGQILLNFASNAVKFTEHGSIVVRGNLVSETEQQVLVRFEVSDTGIGMTTEQCERLFQAFEQADVSTTRKFGGTGLGLAISKRLAELMGGNIGATSIPGEGSRFWLEVPLGKVAGRGHRTSNVTLPAGTRVLVVDDVEDARHSLTATLSELGAEPDACSDGAAALTAIAEADRQGKPYGMVLVDWQMPGMDGLSVGRKLIGMPLAQRPIVFLVSGMLDAPIRHLQSHGFAGFIPKPMTASSLLMALERHLDNTRTEADPSTVSDHVQQLHGHRILLAEDNPLNQEVAVTLLRDVGLLVELANDGQEAVEMARTRLYDLILMDIQMPRLDGLEATRSIRALPQHMTTPIIAMTANAFEEDRQNALGAGMNDHIAKPVDPNRLYDTLSRWLGREVLAHTGPAVLETPTGGLDQIPGLNLRAGLRSTLGNEKQLRQLLQMFVDAHHNDSAKIRQCLQGSSLHNARLILHSLKGSAGSVGITEVARYAARLEESVIKIAPIDSMINDLAKLEQALNAICGHLQIALQPATKAASSATTAHVDLPRLIGDLVRLRQLVATDDLSAVDAFAALQTDFSAVAGRSVTRLGLEIEDFAFAEALVTLDAILDAHPQLKPLANA